MALILERGFDDLCPIIRSSYPTHFLVLAGLGSVLMQYVLVVTILAVRTLCTVRLAACY